MVLVVAALVAPVEGQPRPEEATATGGVFYGTELDDPDRSAYLVWVADAVAGIAPVVWVDFGADECATGDDRDPIVTIAGTVVGERPSGVEVFTSFFHLSHCVNDDQIRRRDIPANFRYDPVTDTLKQTVANGGPATLRRICDGSGFGGTGSNLFHNVVTGTDRGDRIVGTAARDLIDARAGNDVVLAGSGNDIVCVGEGNNKVRAGKGFDIVIGNEGIDILRGGFGHDLLLGDENADTLAGERGNDIMVGGITDRDVLLGGPGNDSLHPTFGAANGGPGPADYCRGPVDVVVSCEVLE